MDADIQIMVAGTVQTDCQVCHSVTVSFLTHGFRHLWLWSFLSLCCLRTRRERGGASFGAGAADGSKFPLSRWSQGRIEPPNSEGEAGFASFAQQTEFRYHHLNGSLLSCSILKKVALQWPYFQHTLNKLDASTNGIYAISKLLGATASGPRISKSHRSLGLSV